ncbi:MAG: polar amino acid ABC transporter permease [Chloroflexi bacterium]|nr:MAG: polar amino acid ABC transporter permease [Chloroflexota bacterium]
MSVSELRTPGRATPFYRDVRIVGVLIQVAFVIAVLIAGLFLVNNMVAGLRASNIPLGWNFLRQEAGFAISEGPAFNPAQSYARAFVVGIANTIRVAISGIILATVVGVFMGIARLSNNWLVRTLAATYVEVVRNTPLLVQLFFWYFAVILKLPNLQASATIPGIALLSNRGIALTWPRLSATGQVWLYWLLAAAVIAASAGLIVARRRTRERYGGSGLALALLIFCVTAVLGYGATAATVTLPANTAYTLQRGDRGVLFVDQDGDGNFSHDVDQPLRFVPVTLLSATGAELGAMLTDAEGGFRFFGLAEEGATLTWKTPAPIVFDRAILQGFNYRGGQQLSPEFAALLVGLTIYTGAFIAEVVRAGINAVPKGQWEASRAVGLSVGQTLRLVVLPQALRVIIPPLTSQYLNLTKNSSLAIAVGYPDLFNVSRTIFNQSGATVQMFVLIMATYLSLSLLTSAFMNWYNRRVALVER